MFKITIVDEESANAATYARLHGEFPGCRVKCFDSPVSALRESVQSIPDVLVIDDGIPEMDPIEFARRFRDSAGVKRLLIFLMSSRQQSANGNVVDGFLPKPIDADLFMILLHRALGLRDARNKLAARAG
ncbi:MAG: response regulator [Vulcanimicrobiaceae bacterium]|jgi:CheY-like chemotaxis protein